MAYELSWGTLQQKFIPLICYPIARAVPNKQKHIRAAALWMQKFLFNQVIVE